MTLMLFAGLAMVGLGPNHIRESGHWVFEFLMDPFCGPSGEKVFTFDPRANVAKKGMGIP